MDSDDEKEIIRLMKCAIADSRGYADFFDWAPDRERAELGVVESFEESLRASGVDFFSNVLLRGRGNDPPDCEATLHTGGRIGLEATELVDPEAIKWAKDSKKEKEEQGKIRSYRWANWDRDKLIAGIQNRLDAKSKPHAIKGGPYDQYVVLIHTDEPILNIEVASALLAGTTFSKMPPVDRAFLLVSYAPGAGVCPNLELTLDDRT